jgi:predicted O-methyltransferase YrrM
MEKDQEGSPDKLNFTHEEPGITSISRHVHSDAEKYAVQLAAEDAELRRVRASLAAMGMRDISVNPAYGRLLTLLVMMHKPRRILEIGALGGYSGICLARGLAEVRAWTEADEKNSAPQLTSLEIKPEYAALAHENMTAAGFGDRVEYRIGAARDTLTALIAQGETFDFFFIDADKGNYEFYLEACTKLGHPGALIVCDNTLLNGKIIDQARSGPSVQAVRLVNERIMSLDEDLQWFGTFLPSFDGMTLAYVR